MKTIVIFQDSLEVQSTTRPQASLQQPLQHRRRSRRRKGSTLVEFAVVVPVLLGMLIGIMEFGWLVRNNHALSNATREGARFAALGKTTADTQERVKSASPLALTNDNIALSYFNSSTNTWVAWPADSNGKNAVPVDASLRVLVRAQHRPLTGFFKFLTSRSVEQSTVMRREL
jgi:Flp pilus assembly protein TadG